MRDRLVAAALEVLQREGAAALTVRNITQLAGCSTTGVYTYFGGKQGLVEAIYLDGFDAFPFDRNGGRLKRGTEHLLRVVVHLPPGKSASQRGRRIRWSSMAHGHPLIGVRFHQQVRRMTGSGQCLTCKSTTLFLIVLKGQCSCKKLECLMLGLTETRRDLHVDDFPCG